jgi:cellulose biosynthesis protein BcsQ
MEIFAGKGGVGKSTCAVARAVYAAKEMPTLLLDYDGGHSANRILGLQEGLKSNVLLGPEITQIKNLYLGILEPLNLLGNLKEKIKKNFLKKKEKNILINFKE